MNTTTKLDYKNLLIFSNAFLKIGCRPILILVESLFLKKDKVFASCYKVSSPLYVGQSIDKQEFNVMKINNFDYMWVLSFGPKRIFLDIIEFLWMLNKQKHVKFINNVESLIFFNNKYILSFLPDFIKTPKTYASNDAEYLYEIVSKHSQKKWILKPPAGSMGRNVFILRKKDTNIKVLIQMLTGNRTKEYCILQEYVKKISTNGEKRVLIARREIICSYTRMPQKDDHRTNLYQGAKPVVAKLMRKEKEYCLKIAKYFKEKDINYIGLDMVYPYILEVNVLNPGGLNTVKDISNKDYSIDAVKMLLKK